MPRIQGYTIYNKKLGNITKEEYVQLVRLALRDGEFRLHLRASRIEPEYYMTDKIFIMKEECSSKIIGWSLCMNDKSLWVYVATKHRRKGYGTELFNRAYASFRRKKYAPTIFKHDKTSTHFYGVTAINKVVNCERH